jgi:hypothetical protein
VGDRVADVTGVRETDRYVGVEEQDLNKVFLNPES